MADMNIFPLSPTIERLIDKLGRDVSLARRRRRLPRASLAERAGIGTNTLRRLEKGDPRVALESLARVLHVLGEAERLGELLDTGADQTGLVLMDSALPKRVRARKSAGAR